MIGRKIGNRYEITDHLGDGSTATVYRALDTRLQREVALKILLPHVRDTTRHRFFQEAASAARLNHPNIMAIYDVDEDENQPYLVTEYVEGQPLTAYIPSPPDVVVNLGAQIAMALHYAHEQGLIHRDIKPANIKVTRAGQIKIMDLGLALGRDSKRLTAEGMIIGTPAYLSPEQAQGHELDERTDIYSLGIVLYEMLTGQLPFDADDLRALLIQQVRQPAPPPRLIVPEIPPPLEQVILKALEKIPVRRFQSARIMAEALYDSLRAPTTPDAPTQPRRPTDVLPRMADKPIRLVLADDHSVLRKALVSSLEAHPGFMVVAEAADGQAALDQTLRLQPDVLLLDLNMPGRGGLDILPEVRAKAPEVRVLVLTGREEDWYIMQALRAGANGYILKSTDERELTDAINRVVEGNLVLGRGVVEKVVGGLVTGGDNPQQSGLNETERRLLLYVAAGYENNAIARQLNLSMPLVIEMLAGTMDKLGAADRNAAALQALKAGYILLEELQAL